MSICSWAKGNIGEDNLTIIVIGSLLAFFPSPDDKAVGLGSGHWLPYCGLHKNIALCRERLESETENTGSNGNVIDTLRLRPKSQNVDGVPKHERFGDE
ncbi:MAG: hypothetical protein VCF25_20490 [Candidatus Poribacteria bacterium]